MTPDPRPAWYRSLYWRIAFGFVALLAAVILAQGLLFLWLTGRIDQSPAGRTPQHLADYVARQISMAFAEDPELDLTAYVRDSFGDINRAFAVVLFDGRHASNKPEALPPGFAAPLRGRGGRFGGRGGPDGAAFGPGRRRPNSAPIVVNGLQLGIVAVPPGRAAILALNEFGPALALSGLALLLTGATAAALLIFRPTHLRLRELERAAQALGQGRSDVRAPEAGGDEVAALARTFNRMAADLEQRARALAEADRVRRQLLADVSHELMTPLTAIRGYVQTLSMTGLTADEPTRARYLEIADQETYKLEAIIGDLLDLARLEGGGEAKKDDRVSAEELFRRVLDRHLPEIRANDITMQVDVDPQTPSLHGSANRLEQALQNLAANAIRHMPHGGTLTLAATPDGERVRITVRDTGPGIAPEHLPHIFDRFYKADAARSGTLIRSGSGLGLSIVRAIVQQHGGEIRAGNADGGGAVFRLTLPASHESAA